MFQDSKCSLKHNPLPSYYITTDFDGSIDKSLKMNTNDLTFLTNAKNRSCERLRDKNKRSLAVRHFWGIKILFFPLAANFILK